MAIAQVVEAALSQLPVSSVATLEDVLEVDDHARRLSNTLLKRHRRDGSK
jgi:1-deoxy-D-xylulose 5-phosphate reductoisomerase